ncbi:MAG: hypothetical protein KAS12_00350, partial [Candidatus Aenigmarchaeota archaeon]|nr:hypothetical protein [Candidatus Aenigmarchaeota archaeon]
ASTLDDVEIIIYDDGDSIHGDDTLNDGIYSNYFNLTETSTIGIWNVSFISYDTDDVLLNTSYKEFNVTDKYNVSLTIINPNGIVERFINATILVQNSNEFITNVTINCTYGAGPLTNITDLNNGTYVLNFTAPAATGTYNLNCSADKFNNSGLDTQQFYTETSETNMSLNVTPINYTTANISFSKDDYFEIVVNTTDTGGANAKYVNISLSLPQNLSSNSTFESCGNINISLSCIKSFNITIANGTIPGNYTFNISTTWLNPNLLTNTTNISFTTYVLSNPIINTTSKPLSGIVADGKNTLVGNFTVYSIGNDNLTNTTFNVSGLSDFTITFNPTNVSNLGVNSSNVIFV